MYIPSLLGVITQIESAYQIMCRPILDEFGIPGTAFDILMFLNNNPSHYTAREISSMRRIKPSVVSMHVDKLVQDGYLKRETVSEDRRKIRLVCTGKAVPVIKKGQQMQKAFHQLLIKNLTDKELEGFKNCFEVIARNTEEIVKFPCCADQ